MMIVSCSFSFYRDGSGGVSLETERMSGAGAGAGGADTAGRADQVRRSAGVCQSGESVESDQLQGQGHPREDT